MRPINMTVPVGSTVPLTLHCQTKSVTASVYSDKTIDSATVHVYEEGQDTAGSATGGSASTVVDTARTEAIDFWNGRYLEFQTGDNRGEVRKVSDFTATSDTLTLDVTTDALPATPASGDEYVIRGYPIISEQAIAAAGGSLSTCYAYFSATAANGCTATPRTVVVVITATYTDGGRAGTETATYRLIVEPV